MVADKYLSEANANIYHEPMPTNINEIEPMMCQDSISIQEDLAEAFDGQAILARMIPLKGQELEDEYKKDIGEIIGRALTKTNLSFLFVLSPSFCVHPSAALSLSPSALPSPFSPPLGSPSLLPPPRLHSPSSHTTRTYHLNSSALKQILNAQRPLFRKINLDK